MFFARLSDPAMSSQALVLTEFGADRGGPKVGQAKLADLDGLG